MRLWDKIEKRLPHFRVTTFSRSDFILCLVIILDAGLEHALVYTADRAAPVIGKVLELGSGSNAVLGIAFLRIISIPAGVAKIFLHDNKPPFMM